MLFSDNRTTENWGCRATSLALHAALHLSQPDIVSIYGKTKRTVYSTFPYGAGARKRVFGRVNRLIEKTHNLLSDRPLFTDPRALTSRLFDFNLLQRDDSLPRFRSILDMANGPLVHVKKAIDKCDEIIVNGEGDMIFSDQRRTLRFMLLVMEHCLSLGKSVHFVNAMISDPPAETACDTLQRRCIETLRKCATIQLRDNHSVDLMKERAPEVAVKFVPDALFTWHDRVQRLKQNSILEDADIVYPFGYDHLHSTIDFSRPYICVGGSSLAPTLDSKKLIDDYCQLCRQLSKLDHQVILFQSCLGDAFLLDVAADMNLPLLPVRIPILLAAAILGSAALIVSGRYHPTVMAALGGTPAIVLNSNSHKNKALLELLNHPLPIEYPLAELRDQTNEVVTHAESLLNQSQLRESIRSRADELGTAAMLSLKEIVAKTTAGQSQSTKID